MVCVRDWIDGVSVNSFSGVLYASHGSIARIHAARLFVLLMAAECIIHPNKLCIQILPIPYQSVIQQTCAERLSLIMEEHAAKGRISQGGRQNQHKPGNQPRHLAPKAIVTTN